MTGRDRERRGRSRRAESFGAYVKSLRRSSGASLRTVAGQVGLSFPHLGRIERGEVGQPPSVHVLTKMADVYRADLLELMERAGVRYELNRPPRYPDAKEQFERLMLCPEFITPEMKPEYLSHFPQLHRGLIRDLAAAVERHTEKRVRWELRKGDDEEPCPAPVSMRTFGEIIGAATANVVINPDWKDRRRGKSLRAKSFGAYIKSLRTSSGASLRTVAGPVGLSFPHLGRIERAEVGQPPSVHVLTKMADVYGRDPLELMERAGVSYESNRPDRYPGAEEQFERLMLCPEFVTPEMKPEYLAHFPRLHRGLIRDLAAAVERHTEKQIRWELRKDDDEEPCPAPVSMRTFGEIIGAATADVVIDPDWKEST